MCLEWAPDLHNKERLLTSIHQHAHTHTHSLSPLASHSGCRPAHQRTPAYQHSPAHTLSCTPCTSQRMRTRPTAVQHECLNPAHSHSAPEACHALQTLLTHQKLLPEQPGASGWPPGGRTGLQTRPRSSTCGHAPCGRRRDHTDGAAIHKQRVKIYPTRASMCCPSDNPRPAAPAACLTTIFGSHSDGILQSV